MLELKILILFLSLQISVKGLGILYPKANPSRFLIPLDGLWKLTFPVNGSFDYEDENILVSITVRYHNSKTW